MGRARPGDATSAAICGQEIGTKKESLGVARKYPPRHTLMVGDAPGDYSAAVANKALFFPINPAARGSQLAALHDEGIDRFFAGTFAGEYQQQLLDEFDTLPARPTAVARRGRLGGPFVPFVHFVVKPVC